MLKGANFTPIQCVKEEEPKRLILKYGHQEVAIRVELKDGHLLAQLGEVDFPLHHIWPVQEHDERVESRCSRGAPGEHLGVARVASYCQEPSGRVHIEHIEDGVLCRTA